MPPPVTPVNQPRAGPNIGRRSGPLFGDLLGMNGWLWNHNDYIVLKVSLSAAASSSIDDKRTLAIWKKASYWVYILNPVESYQLLLCYNITKLPNISVSSRLSGVLPLILLKLFLKDLKDTPLTLELEDCAGRAAHHHWESTQRIALQIHLPTCVRGPRETHAILLTHK